MPGQKNRNVFRKFISLITYKEKPQIRSFAIPETEDEAQTEQYQKSNAKITQAQKQDSKSEQFQVQDSKNGQVQKQNPKNEQAQKQNSINGQAREQNTADPCLASRDTSADKAKRYRTIKRPRPVEELLAGKANSGDSHKRGINTSSRADRGESIKKSGSGGDSKDTISTSIDDNLDFIRCEFSLPANIDIIIRELLIGEKFRAFIVYVEGMVDRATINEFILRPLLKIRESEFDTRDCLVDHIFYSVVETNQNKKISQPQRIIDELLAGNTGIYIDGCDHYILCETKGFAKRAVEKPQIEGSVKGSQEAFTEDLRTNITLIRRAIKNKNLITEIITVGDRNHSQCGVMYLKGIANPAIVEEVKRRLKGIKTDLVLGDGYIEQYIEDSPRAMIPTILSTERPDRTATHLLDGKVAILSEGAPSALIVPITLFTLLHTPEDAALKWQFGIMLRLIRLFAVFISTLLPGIYVAMVTFHKEMIPTDLLIAIASARENVPFPTVFEVVMMEIAFELIREAGIRIPGIIGNTIGIIGALIIGQAAVQASLVSPELIIVVALTGLGNFAIPDFNLAFTARIMRGAYIILGGFFGFFGISIGIILTVASLVNLKSFGVPMFSGIAPKKRQSTDLILRSPLWKQEQRPDELNTLDTRRQAEYSRQWTKQPPKPSGNGSGKKGGEKKQ